MLRRGDIAQIIGPGRPGDGAADGGGEMIVPWGDVRGQRSEDIERRPGTDPFLDEDVALDIG